MTQDSREKTPNVARFFALSHAKPKKVMSSMRKISESEKGLHSNDGFRILKAYMDLAFLEVRNGEGTKKSEGIEKIEGKRDFFSLLLVYLHCTKLSPM